MKCKAVEKTEPKLTKKMGLVLTAQLTKNILIINMFKDKILQGRHCINIDTKEYAQQTQPDGVWSNQMFVAQFGYYPPWYYGKYELQKKLKIDAEDEELIRKCLDEKCSYKRANVVDIFCDIESDYSWQKRLNAENNRIQRVKNEMSLMQQLPNDLDEWLFNTVAKDVNYIFWDKEKTFWKCTACSSPMSEKKLSQSNNREKVKHNDKVICPYCKAKVQAKKRVQRIEIKTRFVLMENMDEGRSVARHFDAGLVWNSKGRELYVSEAVRLVMYRNGDRKCRIYYSELGREYAFEKFGQNHKIEDFFDYKNNYRNRKMGMAYLYPQGVAEALAGTAYEPWNRIFVQMASKGVELNYNGLMAAWPTENVANTAEYLWKGRFYRLLTEMSERIWLYNGEYYGPLNIRGTSIEEVFGIQDRQMINRIRDVNGGTNTIEWLSWADRNGKKIPQEALEWVTENHIEVKDISFIEELMSVQKIMNYVIRQQKESYRATSAAGVLNQWADYMSMCEKLKRDVTDEMIYKPRELKRRHNEAVNEINARQDELIADDYSNRFPGAEDVLNEIRTKFEYENEEYKIIVPNRLVDIVAEGRALHHCAGSSDRYFDRIAQRETYIVFLRKQSEPTIPYYTVEVEPGGTIRQHRGYLDEEPEIELVKPFLKEWQRELKKRLSKEDMEYAKISAVKREENIQELIAKNNTRVLEGLMEDFMEAV